MIFINNSEDKPVKFVYNNPDDLITEDRLPNAKETQEKFKYSLIRMKYSNCLSGQQYRSERGKVRKQQYSEVLNFIKRRNTNEHDSLILFMNTKQTFYSFVFTIDVGSVLDTSNINFGIYSPKIEDKKEGK